MITELDVDVLPLTKEGQIIGTVMSHEQFQLEEFKTLLDPYAGGLPDAVQQQLAASCPRFFQSKQDKIERVIVWGVYDVMSWKNDYPIPGRKNHPMLFDRNRKPKPAFGAVLGVAGDSKR